MLEMCFLYVKKNGKFAKNFQVDKNQVQFYDGYINNQIKTSFNERQFYVIKRTTSFLKSTPNQILEIGCGIGIMSFLLSRKYPNSQITSIDISPASISFAKTNNLKTKNVTFFCYNLIEDEPIPFKTQQFDTIILFDVLEHIPLKFHPKLFEKLKLLSQEGTRLIINIPNHRYIDSCRINNPDVLQIIDESVIPEKLLEHARLKDFHLTFFESYDLWFKNEYNFLVFDYQTEFIEKPKYNTTSLIDRIKRSIFYRKLKFTKISNPQNT